MEEKDCPVPGWKRLVCQRKSGKTAGKSDVYYVNPTGKRLRSRREVLKYLKETGLDIPLDSFCFQTREHLSGFTEIKKKKITQGCTPAAHSVYFAKDKTKNKDVVTNIEKCSCCCEDKISGIKEESIQCKEKPTSSELVPEEDNYDNNSQKQKQQHKLKTSPYFKNHRCSLKPVEMDGFVNEGKTSPQSPKSTKSLLSLDTREESVEDSEFQSSGLQNYLCPKPTRLRNLSTSTISSEPSTSIVTRLPSQEELLKKKLQPSTDDFEKLPPGLQKFFTLQYAPPKSPFNLIQEELYKDPWKLLVATIFLNKTGGKNAIPVLWKFFELFPDAYTTSRADATRIEDIIQPLGLFRKRAQILIRFSEEYLSTTWHYPNELYGIGKYGNDSFRIFCLGEYQDVLPDDHKLNLYHTWLCERDRQKVLSSTS